MNPVLHNPVLKYAAYCLGATALLGGSFFTFAVLSGTPMSQVPGIGVAFPAPPDEEADLDAEPEPNDAREELAADRRSAGQVYGRARGPLQAFLLDNPFSAGELEELADALKSERRSLAVRESALEKLRAELDEERRHYQGLFAELEELRTALVARNEEQEAREAELRRQASNLEEVERASYRNLASVYAEGKADTTAGMLAQTYAPEKAALILAALDDERAAALLAEIHEADPARGALYMDAFRQAKAPQATRK